MEVQKEMSDNILSLSISGDLDASSAIVMDDAMKEALTNGNDKVIIDCQGLNYISSAGLGVFIAYMDQFKESSSKFVLFNMQDQVYNVFQILGLDKVLSITGNEQEARQQFNES